MLKIGNFTWPLKSPSSSRICNAKITKAHNGRQAEKMSHVSPNRMSNLSCSRDKETTNTKKDTKKDSIGDRNTIGCAASYKTPLCWSVAYPGMLTGGGEVWCRKHWWGGRGEGWGEGISLPR